LFDNPDDPHIGIGIPISYDCLLSLLASISKEVKKGQGIGEAGSIQALESLRYLLVVQPSSVSVENDQPHFPKTVRFRLVV
jgi:hypothetical protein